MRFKWTLLVISVLAVVVGLFVLPFGNDLDTSSPSTTSMEEIYSQNPLSVSPKSLINIPTANSSSAAVLSNEGDNFSRFRAQGDTYEDMDDPIYVSPQPDTTDKKTEIGTRKSSVDESVSYLRKNPW